MLPFAIPQALTQRSYLTAPIHEFHCITGSSLSTSYGNETRYDSYVDISLKAVRMPLTPKGLRFENTLVERSITVTT